MVQLKQIRMFQDSLGDTPMQYFSREVTDDIDVLESKMGGGEMCQIQAVKNINN